MATAYAAQDYAVDEGVVATAAQVEAWLSVAKAGDRFVYGPMRATLPLASSGRRRMLELANAGLVLLTRPRRADVPTMFNYTAVRSTAALPGAKPEGRPVLSAVRDAIVDGEIEAIDRLLPVLERFANAGRPCPTDRDLAARADLPREQIPQLLDVLRLANAIRVYAAPAPTNRRVHIVATGATTGIAK
ncbi:hypothetical protein [Sphingomonas corticis]|uniref:Transcriptional regulator n=1 Tax=Sphingomonas corticis TaxID=2722791 RepID=A0ABX1CRA0_9SPHN|nr:hypothetical protein [Sphingomonas corticis]NJR80434.1 hypothetical protein [Sphingomonas corticis]